MFEFKVANKMPTKEYENFTVISLTWGFKKYRAIKTMKCHFNIAA